MEHLAPSRLLQRSQRPKTPLCSSRRLYSLFLLGTYRLELVLMASTLGATCSFSQVLNTNDSSNRLSLFIRLVLTSASIVSFRILHFGTVTISSAPLTIRREARFHRVNGVDLSARCAHEFRSLLQLLATITRCEEEIFMRRFVRFVHAPYSGAVQ
jgi:hypothetical protein